MGDRALHLAGLQFLPAGRRLSRQAGPARPTSSRCRSTSTTGTTSAGRIAFATRATTERQRAYARVLKQRYVYTPGDGGRRHRPRHRRERGPIEALLADAQRRSPQRATPELSRAVDGPLTIKLAAFAARRPAGRRHARRSTTAAIRRRWRAARTRAACSRTSTSCAIFEIVGPLGRLRRASWTDAMPTASSPARARR